MLHFRRHIPLWLSIFISAKGLSSPRFVQVCFELVQLCLEWTKLLRFKKTTRR
jgi:hypothetical protein